jgi:hypothetical protein
MGEVHEEGNQTLSNQCTCASAYAYGGARCLACTPRTLADGGSDGLATCVQYEQNGCAVAPGLAPVLVLLWLFRRWRSSARLHR